MTGESIPRRSDATRAAILEAARHRFAADGFRSTTIRAIAADAGIDPSMVMRYYGNKDGLFDAALDIELDMPDLLAVPPDSLGERLVRHFLGLWETPPGNTVMLTMLRTALTDATVAQRIQHIVSDQVMPMVLSVGDPEDGPRRCGLIATQMLGLALCRYGLKLPQAAGLSEAEIVAEIGATIQRYLTSPPDDDRAPVPDEA